MGHRTFTAWPALAFALAACGSGSSGSAPTLSNLDWSPRTGTPGIPLQVTATLDVADPDADVARLELSGSHSSGATLAKAVASPNLKLTLDGTGFVPGSVVQWNGAERSTVWRSATQVVAYIPASDLLAAAAAQVTVVSPAPGGGASTAAMFTVGP
jgi:hypothetical protein